jgi:hypothetical protein
VSRLPSDGNGERGPRKGIYRLRKWYCDFLTSGLDYCFVYYADVSLFGATFRSLTVHLARPRKGTPITKTIPLGRVEEVAVGSNARTFRFDGGQIAISDGPCSVDVAGSGLSVHLRFVPTEGLQGLPVEIRNGGQKRIVWKPLHLKSRVSGSIVVGEETVEVMRCDGYVDSLESTFLPPVVPVHTLYWGRLHHPELDLVFMRAGSGPEGPAWSRMSIRSGKSLTEWEDLQLVNMLDPLEPASREVSHGGYYLHASSGSRRAHLQVRHVAPVQVSSFIDHQEVRCAAVRYILKKLTRDPRSTKWLSYADVVVEDPASTLRITNIPMIDEFALL